MRREERRNIDGEEEKSRGQERDEKESKRKMM